MKVSISLRFLLLCLLAAFLCSCAEETLQTANNGSVQRIKNVRTTAYTHSEGGGRHNALGQRLAGAQVKSAASDWSRYPLGTRFRLASTSEEFVIDDYGGALVGTGTIDLYKRTRSEVRAWGVRHVDIDVLRWGSKEESLKVLRPRRNNHLVRRMMARLEKKKA